MGGPASPQRLPHDTVPQPASKARRTLYSLSVGGAEAARKRVRAGDAHKVCRQSAHLGVSTGRGSARHPLPRQLKREYPCRVAPRCGPRRPTVRSSMLRRAVAPGPDRRGPTCGPGAENAACAPSISSPSNGVRVWADGAEHLIGGRRRRSAGACQARVRMVVYFLSSMLRRGARARGRRTGNDLRRMRTPPWTRPRSCS